MSRKSLLILASLSLLACNKDEPISSKFHTITGKVLDSETGSALAAVTISTEPPTEQSVTNTEGKFVIDLNVKVGQRYRVNASKQGYLPNHAELTVQEGENTTSDIVLQKEKAILGVSPSTLDFGVSKNSLQLTIENLGKTGEFTWVLHLPPNEPWITADKISGQVTNQSQVVNISVNRTGLEPRNYSASIAITPDNNVDLKRIDVIMTVQNPNAPQMSVNKNNIDFGDSQSSTTVQVTNTGTGILEWTVTSNSQNWLTISPSGGACNSGDTKSFNITAQRANLNFGSYQGTITISSNGAAPTNTHNINVKLSVTASPVLQVSPDSLDFGDSATMKSFTISNSGKGTLSWQVTDNQDWITLNSQNGSNTGTVNVTVSRTRLTTGNYSGIASVTSNGGNGTVNIFMNVPAPRPPTAVTLGAPTNITTNSMTLSWTQNTDSDFAAYKAYYSTSPSVNETSILATTITTKTTTSYTVTGLSSNTNYYFRVFVLAQTQQTSGSNTVTGKTEKTFPSWRQVASPVNFQLQSMHYISENNIWVAGYTTISNYNFPRIYQFNGSGWVQNNVQSQDSVGELTAIAFRNNSEGWAASANRIYKYDGSSWKVQRYLSNSSGIYYHISEAIGTSSDIWFYGDKVQGGYSKALIYQWNGNQFTELITSNQINNSIFDMHFNNSNTGFAIDEKRNAYMFDGTGWTNLGIINNEFDGRCSVSGMTKNNVWASNNIYLYHYNGTNWERQNDIGGTGIRFYFGQVRMISSTEGWATKSRSPYDFYYYNGSAWSEVGTVSGDIQETKDFGNGNLWGIIYGFGGDSNKLMRLQ